MKFHLTVLAFALCLFSATASNFRTYPLDLHSAVNMGFADEIAGDEIGGWSDQGPDNDLRMIPTGPQIFGEVDFNIIDPAQNNGLSCIVLGDSHRPYFPKKIGANQKEDPECSGKYLHILHGLCWATGGDLGKICLTFDDNSSQEILVTGNDVGNWWTPGERQNGDVAWTAMNNSTIIGLYRSIFPIRDKRVKRIDFETTEKSVWCIVAATLVKDEIKRIPKPGFLLKESDIWKPVEYTRDTDMGSVLDFSDILDAPAGKYGRIISRDGHLYFSERPDKQARFFGTNLCSGAEYIDHEWADRLADRLASFGFNSVRYHHHDNGLGSLEKSSILKEKAIDQLDYLTYALKRRGIYITTDFFVSRSIRKNEIPNAMLPIKNFDYYKALLWIDDAVFENWKEFTWNFLNHYNPYTGYTYAEEPAMVGVCLVNEGGIDGCASISPEIQALYDKKYNQWREDKGLSIPEDSRKKKIQYATFLSEIYKKRYNEMVEYVRSQGAQYILSDNNNGRSPFRGLLRNGYDYVDCHNYWAHPSFPGASWGLPAEIHQSSILIPNEWMSHLCIVRQLDKPFFITEFDSCRPNQYRAEHPSIMAAWARLQDWDALYQFAYAHGTENVVDPLRTKGFFDIATDPVKHLAYRIGCLMFLKATMPAGEKALAMTFSPDNVPAIDDSYPVSFGRMGRFMRTGSIAADRHIPDDVIAVVDLDGSYTGPLPTFGAGTDMEQKLREAGICTPDLYDMDKGIINACNGTMHLDVANQTMVIKAPEAEAITLHEGQELSGNFLTAKAITSNAMFAVAAHNGLPLSEARRILILHVTDSEPSEVAFADETLSHMDSYGKTPFLFKQGLAQITLKTSPGNYKLYSVNLNGKRIAEIPFNMNSDGSLTFTANVFANSEPSFAYELLKF